MFFVPFLPLLESTMRERHEIQEQRSRGVTYSESRAGNQTKSFGEST